MIPFIVEISGSNHSYCFDAVHAAVYKHLHMDGDAEMRPAPLPGD